MATTIITGRISQIFDSEIFGNNFEKRILFVEETGSKYPNTWQLEMQQGKCNELDLYELGQEVIAQCEVRGKKWTSREGREMVFTTLKVNDLQLATASASPIPKQSPAASPSAYPVNQSPVNSGTPIPPQPVSTPNEEDDLPF